MAKESNERTCTAKINGICTIVKHGRFLREIFDDFLIQEANSGKIVITDFPIKGHTVKRRKTEEDKKTMYTVMPSKY